MAGTITQLQLQKRDKQRVNVFLDGEYAFAVDLLTAAGLRKGQPLDDAEIGRLLAGDEATRAYHAAVRQLGVRARSRMELEQALRRKQFSGDAAQAALLRLEAEGLIDDADFARAWAESRTTFRPRGLRALRYELRAKGVSSEEVDAALEGIDEEEAALAALRSRERTWESLSGDEAEQKALGFLQRRGFGYESARRAWRRLNEAEPDAPSDE